MSETHRIALISDLHGNAIALRETLSHIEALGVDEIVFLGDAATLGVAPAETIDLLQRIGCRCILGNHDEYVFDPKLSDGHNDASSIREAIDWCRDVLPREHIDFLRGFEAGFVLPLGRGHQLMLYHGSPSSNCVDLLAETAPDVFDAQLGPERATVMSGGHTHVQMVRQHRGTLVVNPGSVGAPFREFVDHGPPAIEPRSEYATVSAQGANVSVALHRVELDRHALAKAAQESANPMRQALASHYLRTGRRSTR
ncbi:MAG: metallophosphoesterase family protein [Myxococcota bacterium]